ncbi:MAG: metallophosphoesterase [Clostridia bacterium]|nr:metallophosphoesterase [Clostridia bacterium]
MKEIGGFFYKVLAYIMVVILPVTSLFGMVWGGVDKTDVKKDEVLFTAALISDTHIKNSVFRTAIFDAGLRDVSKNVQPDLLLVAGDCTDNGNEENWEAFKKSMDKADVANKLVTMGNHDTWTSYDTPHDYEPALQNFINYGGAIMNREIDGVNFTYDVNGYRFIVLGSDDTSTAATLSDEQLAWADEALAEAAAEFAGKPLFVVLHQPLNYTHAVGDNEHNSGINGDASEKLLEIMDKYENVFFFSGHQHYGLSSDAQPNLMIEGFKTIEYVSENITSINLPSYEYGSYVTGGEPHIGQGLVMYVFEDSVRFIGRNFALGGWISSFDVTVPLA